MRLYRIVVTNPPTEYDFLSHSSRTPTGASPCRKGADAALIREWAGVSTFTSRDYAAATNAAMKGRLGAFVAELEVPDSVEADFGAVRPLGRHVNLFGVTPQQLMDCVVGILAL